MGCKRIPDAILKLVVVFGILIVTGTAIVANTKVKADMGPKPSIVVNFTGLDEITYYVTLLSETDSTGPFSVYRAERKNLKYTEEDPEYEISQKFIEYQDKDGFYYLQYLQKCADNKKFSWSYYPPQRFKILIYIPDYDMWIKNDEIYERYAFDSYYQVDVTLEQQSMDAEVSEMEVKKSYELWTEIGKLIVRILLTIAVELIVAMLFWYSSKKDYKVIILTNVFTQTILNVAANIVMFQEGFYAYVLMYFALEIVIIMIEAKIYKKYLENERHHEKSWSGLPVLYAVLANAVSFAFGIYLGAATQTSKYF